ncbi:SH3 domain-containing protein [Proteinivorax hydrogeniformans]|uniref:SH3 domain-containing protein n=1 Tax=Proteinivorax hydrogeniformans TaxID=1826727 RepID=A0AAU8HVV9_9FIRM
MPKKIKVAIIVALVIVFSIVGAQIGWTNTAQPGSENDPLISKSYLDSILSVFRSEVEDDINKQDEKIDELIAMYDELKDEIESIQVNGGSSSSENSGTDNEPKNEKPEDEGSNDYDTAKVVVDASTVNFRSGSGTSYSRLTTVSRNDVINAINYENQWIQGDVNGTTGWIAAWLVKPKNGHSLEYINANTVNVRTGPGTNYDRITTVSRGDILRVVDTKGDWNNVILSDGTKAWVYSPLSNEVQY